MIYQIVAYDNQNKREVVETTADYQVAQAVLFSCEEGDDKFDPCEYSIEVAE